MTRELVERGQLGEPPPDRLGERLGDLGRPLVGEPPPASSALSGT